MATSRKTMTLAQMRAIYNEHRNDKNDKRFWVINSGVECRQAWLDGIVDAIRTAFNSPRSPYSPPADPVLAEAYDAGFAIR